MRKTIHQLSISYALIISLIGGMLMPVLASAADSPERVLLCTSQGYQWIDVSDSVAKVVDETSNTSHCIFYHITCGDAAADIPSLLSFILSDEPHSLIWHDPSVFSASLETASAQARAPPFFI